jgi:hypothetical protein
MNKREAKEIISNQLDAYRKRPYSELVEMIDTDPIAYKVNGPSGTSYQIEIAASWDDKPNGNIRVIGAIADHGLKAFAPMLFDEFIKSPKDEFKSILIKSWTGGVRSDDWKTPWPFAKLKLTSYELILNAILPTDFGFEKAELCFERAEIDHLEIYRGSLPLIGRVSRGVGIIHNKPEYPKGIIFWYFGDVEELATSLVRMGFGSRAVPAKLPTLFV